MTENEQLKNIWKVYEGIFVKAFPEYASGPLFHALDSQVKRLANLPAYAGMTCESILIEAKRIVEEHLEALTEQGRAFSMTSWDEKMTDARCVVESQLAALRYYLENAFSCDESDCGEATTIENICNGLDRGAAMLSEVYPMTKGEGK